ncbi:MAG: hypothetical protein PVF83_00660 [Anaerolineales bacterium]
MYKKPIFLLLSILLLSACQPAPTPTGQPTSTPPPRHRKLRPQPLHPREPPSPPGHRCHHLPTCLNMSRNKLRNSWQQMGTVNIHVGGV